MARKRQTAPKTSYNGGSVTVINASASNRLYLNLGIKVEHEGKEELREVGTRDVNQGSNAIALVCQHKPEEVLGWWLGFNQYGVLWRDNGVFQEQAGLDDRHDISEQWRIDVLPSGTYYLDSDPKNMPLTDPQYVHLNRLLLRQLQKPAPYSQLWTLVRKQLPPVEEFGPIPEKLQVAYESFDYNRTTLLPHWHTQYPMLQLAADPNKTWVTQQLLDSGLSVGGRAHIDVYWRALDRQPGGNNDIHTVCYTFDCATQSVSTRHATNGDGTLQRKEYQPKNLSTAIQSPTGGFSTVLTALRALGPGDSECTILDTTSQDAHEYDTTWTSHEILVSLPKPWTFATHAQFPPDFRASVFSSLCSFQRLAFPPDVIHRILELAAPSLYVPVVRLHQRCVLGPQWRTHEALPEILTQEIPPNPLQQEAITAVHELVGMGRVHTWSDAGDGAPGCPAHYEEQDNLVQDDSYNSYMTCCLHPLYFDFPARNVAQEKEGTSAEWLPQKKRSREE